MISFPWDSIVERMEDGYPVYDRAYSAAQYRDLYQTFFCNGVFPKYVNGTFSVTAGTGMTVKVSPGRANVQGAFCQEDNERVLSITAATSVPRIDTVVLRFDASTEARKIDLYVRQGVAQASPVRPTLTRTETVWELGLCDIMIPANTTSITNDRITDTRSETARCGWVFPFAEIDTTTFYNQLQAALNKMTKELQDATDKAVEAMEHALDGTEAGHLQNQIDAINDYTTGINLLRGTRDFTLGTKKAAQSGSEMKFDGWLTLGTSLQFEKDAQGFTVAYNENAQSSNNLFSSVAIAEGLKKGDKVTIVIDVLPDDGIVSNNLLVAIAEYQGTEAAYVGTATKFREFTKASLSQYSGIELTPNAWQTIAIPYDIQENNPTYIWLYFRIGAQRFKKVRKVAIYRDEINNPIWSPSPFDVDYINDETTGTNLINGTKDFRRGRDAIYRNYSSFDCYSDGFDWVTGDFPNAIGLFESDGVTALKITSTTTSEKYAKTSGIVDIQRGETLTLFGEIMFPNASKMPTDVLYIAVRDQYSDKSFIGEYVDCKTLGFTADNIDQMKWYPFRYTITIPSNATGGYYFRAALLTRSICEVAYRKIGVYRGNIKHPVWSQSIMDMNELDEGTPGVNLIRGSRDIALGTKQLVPGNANYFKDGFKTNAAFFIVEDQYSDFTMIQSNQSHDVQTQVLSPAIPVDSPGDYTFFEDVQFQQKPTNDFYSYVNYYSADGTQIKSFRLGMWDAGIDPSKADFNVWYKARSVVNIDNETFKFGGFLIRYYSNIRVASGSAYPIYKKPGVYKGNIHNPIWSISPFDLPASNSKNPIIAIEKFDSFPSGSVEIATGDSSIGWYDLPKKEGYKPVAIASSDVSWSGGACVIEAAKVRPDSNEVNIAIRNISTSQKTSWVDVKMDIIYVLDGFFSYNGYYA